MTLKEKLDREMKSLEGIFYRRDQALTTGRNAESTDALIDARWRNLWELLSQPGGYEVLDKNKRMSDRYKKLERKMAGLPT